MKKKVLCSILMSALLVGCSLNEGRIQNTPSRNAKMRTASDIDRAVEAGVETEVQDAVTEVQEEDRAQATAAARAQAAAEAQAEVQARADIETWGIVEVRAEEGARIAAQAAAEAQAAEEAQAAAEEERAAAEAQAAEEAQTRAEMQSSASQNENVVTIVSKVYIEDCGLDSGYWEITYSDGHVEYIDD